MAKRQLLFVTYRDESLEEGASYAIELAKVMFEDISLLFVQKKQNLMNKIENLMTAVTFAEADEHETALQVMATDIQKSQDKHENKLAQLMERCREAGIHVSVHTSELDAVSGIRVFLKHNTGIDKVVLSPAVTEKGNVSAKDMNRLVRTASRPIVTMTRQACAVA